MNFKKAIEQREESAVDLPKVLAGGERSMNTQIPMPVNGISTPFSIDENIAKMKQTLLKDIQRSAYVYRVDCGGCNGCEIEIFSTITPTFDAERFGIKVVASPRHADIFIIHRCGYPCDAHASNACLPSCARS